MYLYHSLRVTFLYIIHILFYSGSIVKTKIYDFYNELI